MTSKIPRANGAGIRRLPIAMTGSMRRGMHGRKGSAYTVRSPRSSSSGNNHRQLLAISTFRRAYFPNNLLNPASISLMGGPRRW